MQLKIREAEKKDYDSIYQLIRNELGYGQVDYEKLCVRLDLIDSDDKQLTVVAEDNGRIVGFIGICTGVPYNYEGEFMQVLALAVSGDMQKRGIGAELMSWVEEYARKRGISCITLTSRLHRADAHAFYESIGYANRSHGYKKYL